MALLNGSKKIKTAVFISGNGSNLKSLIKFSKLKKSPISVNLIISNNAKSKGLHYGSIYKIKKKIFNLHPSLLPEYKGCSSLTWAIINGESSSIRDKPGKNRINAEEVSSFAR